MSNPIRYDSVLVRYLAAELDARLAGAPLTAFRLDAGRRVAALELADGALVWELHPTRGWVRAGPPPAAPEVVPLSRRTTVAAVTSPPDERFIVFELSVRRRSGGQATRIVVELMGNQWNALALDAEDRIVAVLWRRDAGARRLRPGQVYAGPGALVRAAQSEAQGAERRRGVDRPLGADEWHAVLGPVPAAERARRLIADVAYTSPLNAAALLGEAARTDAVAALDAAYARYAALVAFPPADPHVLALGGGRQPYPLPLPGVPGERVPTLLAAMAVAAGVPARAGGAGVHAIPPEADAVAPAVPPELLDRLRARVRQLGRKAESLRTELEGARPEAAALRRQADLLLGQLHRVRRGATSAELSDFAGGTVQVRLDPALTPAENAGRLYEAARKRERAADRIPALLDRVEAERARWAELLARAEAGAAGEAEVEAVVGRAGAARERSGAAPLPPYRRYRTSGGLEVRVGRNRRANDELTFHHSAPNDVWLHAREAAGAHVVLRWDDAESAPPARDLLEAAVLAALHSRARTSGIAAVDWTRRKYVRKPRKAPPGLVAVERVRTLFVEPDERVERRLRIVD